MDYRTFVAGVYDTVMHKIRVKNTFSDIRSSVNASHPAAGGQQRY